MSLLIALALAKDFDKTPLLDRSGKKVESVRVTFAKPLGTPDPTGTVDSATHTIPHPDGLTWYIGGGKTIDAKAQEARAGKDGAIHCSLHVHRESPPPAEPTGSFTTIAPTRMEFQGGSDFSIELEYQGQKLTFGCERNSRFTLFGYSIIDAPAITFEDVKEAVKDVIQLDAGYDAAVATPEASGNQKKSGEAAPNTPPGSQGSDAKPAK